MFMSELIEWAEFGEDKCIRRKKNIVYDTEYYKNFSTQFFQ